jgi:hypothetical protein
MKPKKLIAKSIFFCVIFICTVSMLVPVSAFGEQVDWQGPSGSRIKAVHHFPKADAPLAAAPAVQPAAAAVDSPPIDGFVPWIVLVPTNRRESEDDWAAVAEPFIRGSFPSGMNPQKDFMIGLFDTGASAHVIGYQNAVRAKLYNSTYLTSNSSVIGGVTGAVDARVSRPLALYMKGLNALEPNSPSDPEATLPSTAGMKGESNISVLIGNNPGSYPDLYTAIGSPMSVYYTTRIENSAPVSVLRNGKTYTAPRITFYDRDDDTAPSYPNRVPLELKPLGAVNVQYTPTIDLFNFSFDPATPSVIIGNSAQSLFFVHSVDLREGAKTAYDKDRFMLDTGAQITVIGSRIAARLGLNPLHKEFEVEIEGVTGESTLAPGFYIDAITIPAIGEWLDYTNVPVVLLDISSPEGGTLDGIIGMNLFTEYNLILRGGGFFLEDDPVLEFERITSPLVGDIAPQSGDGIVNYLDFSVFSAAWLTHNAGVNWNAKADFVPDGTITLGDLYILAGNWLAGTIP